MTPYGGYPSSMPMMGASAAPTAAPKTGTPAAAAATTSAYPVSYSQSYTPYKKPSSPSQTPLVGPDYGYGYGRHNPEATSTTDYSYGGEHCSARKGEAQLVRFCGIC